MVFHIYVPCHYLLKFKRWIIPFTRLILWLPDILDVAIRHIITHVNFVCKSADNHIEHLEQQWVKTPMGIIYCHRNLSVPVEVIFWTKWFFYATKSKKKNYEPLCVFSRMNVTWC